MTMPRRYQGLNLPITVYTAANEMVSAGDAGFENIWSLQDCIETLYEFGDEDQRQRFIPCVCAGATMSMDLTEPDAGSDLQSVMLKATYSEADGCCCTQMRQALHHQRRPRHPSRLARSEEGTKDDEPLHVHHTRTRAVSTCAASRTSSATTAAPPLELVSKNAKLSSRRAQARSSILSPHDRARLALPPVVGIHRWPTTSRPMPIPPAFGKKSSSSPRLRHARHHEPVSTPAARCSKRPTATSTSTSRSTTSHATQLTTRELRAKRYSRLADAFTP
jgi:hypothetical protein